VAQRIIFDKYHGTDRNVFVSPNYSGVPLCELLDELVELLPVTHSLNKLDVNYQRNGRGKWRAKINSLLGFGRCDIILRMNKQAFSLIELLIVVTIIAILVGVALPYYQDYVKETRLTKAKHELDIIKQALIKHDTFEERAYVASDPRVLLGKYLQDLPRDPWGRDYEVDWLKGQVRSLGPDHSLERDNITVDYKPPLTLQKATWVDTDNNRQVSGGDFLRLEFSRFLNASASGNLDYSNSSATGDLWFSEDVVIGTLIPTATVDIPGYYTNEILIELATSASDLTIKLGSSTVGIAQANKKIMDFSGRYANGTYNATVKEAPAVEIIIKAN
jgi:prepilin-type N-terminal cleavage/methylation domain-containing protein